MRLADILVDLRDTDMTLRSLGQMADTQPADEIIPLNIDAVAKRRRELERRLDAELRRSQFDLIRLTVRGRDGGACAASALARSLLFFQEAVTAVFDAIRDGPKRHYAPSAVNADISSMRIAAPLDDAQSVSLLLPNDRLLAMRSELDLAIEIVLALLRLRGERDVMQFGEKIGVAPISKLHQWAAHGARERLRTSIEWRKTEDDIREVSISPVEAAALQQLIEFDLGGTHRERRPRMPADRPRRSEEDLSPAAIGDRADRGLPCRRIPPWQALDDEWLALRRPDQGDARQLRNER